MLEKYNTQLKAGKIGVQIQQIGNRLYLVATLPPKPNSNTTKKHQQRVSLGLYGSVEGIKQAHRLAVKLGGDLAVGTFDWSDWMEAPETIQKASLLSVAASFRQYWLDIYGNDIKRQGTWDKDYHAVICRLPDLPLDPVTLRSHILSATEPNSRTRKKYCTVIGALANHGGITLDLSDIRGNYAGQKRERVLPSDQTIIDVGLNIANPGWRWIYGMLATFGLRNHEVFFIDHDYLAAAGICHVLEGKSIAGKVWPFYPEWFDLFDLKNIHLPNIREGRTHIEYGQKVSKFFQREKILFNAYSLRHCWARRVIGIGLDSRLAAKQMRHSHDVHTSIYNQWIGDEIHQREWERLKEMHPWQPEVH